MCGIIIRGYCLKDLRELETGLFIQLCLPISKSEIKVAECGRYKVPLVASNVGCYDETIKNGRTGYLIDPEASPAEWVKILTKVIRDKKHRDQMGENLHEVTEEYFDMNKVIDQRYTLYKDAFAMSGRTDLAEKLHE